MHPGIVRLAERLGLDEAGARAVLSLRRRIMPHMRGRAPTPRRAKQDPLRVAIGDELRWKLGR